MMNFSLKHCQKHPRQDLRRQQAQVLCVLATRAATAAATLPDVAPALVLPGKAMANIQWTQLQLLAESQLSLELWLLLSLSSELSLELSLLSLGLEELLFLLHRNRVFAWPALAFVFPSALVFACDLALALALTLALAFASAVGLLGRVLEHPALHLFECPWVSPD